MISVHIPAIQVIKILLILVIHREKNPDKLSSKKGNQEADGFHSFFGGVGGGGSINSVHVCMSINLRLNI